MRNDGETGWNRRVGKFRIGKVGLDGRVRETAATGSATVRHLRVVVGRRRRMPVCAGDAEGIAEDVELRSGCMGAPRQQGLQKKNESRDERDA